MQILKKEMKQNQRSLTASKPWPISSEKEKKGKDRKRKGKRKLVSRQAQVSFEGGKKKRKKEAD